MWLQFDSSSSFCCASFIVGVASLDVCCPRLAWNSFWCDSLLIPWEVVCFECCFRKAAAFKVVCVLGVLVCSSMLICVVYSYSYIVGFSFSMLEVTLYAPLKMQDNSLHALFHPSLSSSLSPSLPFFLPPSLFCHYPFFKSECFEGKGTLHTYLPTTASCRVSRFSLEHLCCCPVV